MFDEYLCKHIQKKEITLYDILCYYSLNIAIVLCIAISSSIIIISSSIIICADSVDRNVSVYAAFIDCSIMFAKIIAVFAALRLGIYIVIHILRAIAKIRVATCPNFKPEKDEE